MFYPASVCPSVSNFTLKNYWSAFLENFAGDVSLEWDVSLGTNHSMFVLIQILLQIHEFLPLRDSSAGSKSFVDCGISVLGRGLHFTYLCALLSALVSILFCLYCLPFCQQWRNVNSGVGVRAWRCRFEWQLYTRDCISSVILAVTPVTRVYSF